MQIRREKQKGLRYAFSEGIVRMDKPTVAEQDDPNSAEFVPLEERGEMGKARFWALMAQRDRRAQKAGVFDE